MLPSIFEFSLPILGYYNSSCSPHFDWFPFTSNTHHKHKIQFDDELSFWTWDFPIAYITPSHVWLMFTLFNARHVFALSCLDAGNKEEYKKEKLTLICLSNSIQPIFRWNEKMECRLKLHWCTSHEMNIEHSQLRILRDCAIFLIG